MISFNCPSCGRSFSVPDDFAGREARCACKTVLRVPAASTDGRTVLPPPPPAPEPVSASPAPVGGLRGRRLVADERDLREAFGDGRLGRVISTRGAPPELYVIELRVSAPVAGSAESEPAIGDVHQLEVQLTSDYPRVGPKCRMLTPVFHPNVDAASVCIGDHWAAGERLSDLIVRVAEMLAYQAYNIRSPLNATAAMWADLHPDRLPFDRRNLREVLGR